MLFTSRSTYRTLSCSLLAATALALVSWQPAVAEENQNTGPTSVRNGGKAGSSQMPNTGNAEAPLDLPPVPDGGVNDDVPIGIPESFDEINYDSIVQPLPYKILVHEKVSSSVRAKFPSYKAGSMVLIGGEALDEANTGTFSSPNVMLAQLAEYVPDVNYKGLIVLDWESLAYHRLMETPGSPNQLAAMQEFIKAARFVKAQRPKARVAFYALPFGEYWNRNEAWEQRALAIAPLINEVDVLCPSIYDMYATSQDPRFEQLDAQVVKANVKLALKLARGKPVYPFVWPRFHDSNQAVGFDLIPPSEFKAHVKAATNVAVNGRRIDGIVWWGTDGYARWLYNRTDIDRDHPLYDLWKFYRDHFRDEIPPGMSDSRYFNELNIRILKNLKSATIMIPNPPQ